MATASRSRQPAGAKHRPRNLTAALALDTVRPWIVPGAATVAILAAAGLGTFGAVAMPGALATAILATLVLLAYIGVRPLLAPDTAARDRGIGLAVAAAWVLVCYLPFHLLLFPGTPLVQAVEVSSTGSGLPLRIPAAGYRTLNLLLEGKLAAPPDGGAAPPVQFSLTVIDASGTAQLVDGRFEDALGTRRLGRRGTATVHHLHTGEVHVLQNPSRSDLTVTKLVLDPGTAPPITVTAYAHPLPGTLVLGLAVLALLAGVVAFDGLGPVPDTDGALTLATAAVVGTAIILWTGHAVHPDFQTLIGSAIFGGPLGFAAGALTWWIAKRVVVRPAH